MNPIIKLAASALPGEKKFVLFAGAGVSKDAGVPTAWDVMLKTAGLLYTGSVPEKEQDSNIDLEKWFNNSPYSQMSYAELMGQLYPNYPDQQTFLKQALGNHTVGEAHELIAELARRNIIRAIITTNFDNYLEEALQKKDIAIQVISNDEDLSHCEPLIHCKDFRLYKPHGTLGRGAIRNTPKDLERLSPLMEKELVRVLSEHGVIVIGYSGQDDGIVKVFNKRNHDYYPLFWINPSRPKGNIEKMFEDSRVTYIECTGASQFLNDFINLQDRIKNFVPREDHYPILSDIKIAYSKKEPISSKLQGFLKSISADIEAIKPDFSKFSDYDDAIINQIDLGKKILINFVECVQVVCDYNDEESLKTIYENFGYLLKFYDIPDDFQGSYKDSDFDGNKFLIYEMFVSFIGYLIKSDMWELIGKLLSKDLLVDKKMYGGYYPFQEISQYIYSLDKLRNSRLNLSHTSVTADILSEHFSQDQMNRILTHQEFMEADFFLFSRSKYHQKKDPSVRGWDPISCVYLKRVPNFLLKSESSEFLSRLMIAGEIDDKAQWIDCIRSIKTEALSSFSRMQSLYRTMYSYEPDKIGTRP